jgi:hypothetical protein
LGIDSSGILPVDNSDTLTLNNNEEIELRFKAYINENFLVSTCWGNDNAKLVIYSTYTAPETLKFTYDNADTVFTTRHQFERTGYYFMDVIMHGQYDNSPCGNRWLRYIKIL